MTTATWQTVARAKPLDPLTLCAACGRKFGDGDSVILRSDGRLQCKHRCVPARKETVKS